MATKRDDYYDKTPLEVLEQAMWRPHLVCTRKLLGRHGTPGEVIEGLSEPARKKLRQLKSDDIANIRPDIATMFVGTVPQHLL
jgi:hypothetical protein